LCKCLHLFAFIIRSFFKSIGKLFLKLNSIGSKEPLISRSLADLRFVVFSRCSRKSQDLLRDRGFRLVLV